MRDYPGPRSEQLRFGLATGYAFDAKLTGWKRPDDIAYGRRSAMTWTRYPRIP
jgi:hypothetical protein